MYLLNPVSAIGTLAKIYLISIRKHWHNFGSAGSQIFPPYTRGEWKHLGIAGNVTESFFFSSHHCNHLTEALGLDGNSSCWNLRISIVDVMAWDPLFSRICCGRFALVLVSLRNTPLASLDNWVNKNGPFLPIPITTAELNLRLPPKDLAWPSFRLLKILVV